MTDDFATNLISLRGGKNLSQQQLGDIVGVSPSQISRYEAGLAMPRKTVLRKLCSALGVAMHELVPPEKHALVVGEKNPDNRNHELAEKIIQSIRSVDSAEKDKIIKDAEAAGIPFEEYVLQHAEKNFIKFAEDALLAEDFASAMIFRTLASALFGSNLKIVPKTKS